LQEEYNFTEIVSVTPTISNDKLNKNVYSKQLTLPHADRGIFAKEFMPAGTAKCNLGGILIR